MEFIPIPKTRQFVFDDMTRSAAVAVITAMVPRIVLSNQAKGKKIKASKQKAAFDPETWYGEILRGNASSTEKDEFCTGILTAWLNLSAMLEITMRGGGDLNVTAAPPCVFNWNNLSAQLTISCTDTTTFDAMLEWLPEWVGPFTKVEQQP